VLRGIHAARLAGMRPIRLNAVILKGHNEDAIVDLIRFVERHPQSLELRFIEYMPFEVRAHQCVTGQEIRTRIAEFRSIERLPREERAPGPAQQWIAPETGLRLGFIAPLSDTFCSTCNRLRLSSTGHLRTCLAHEDTPSLRDLIRQGYSDAELRVQIRNMVLGKPEGHSCTVDGGIPFEGVMTGIGG